MSDDPPKLLGFKIKKLWAFVSVADDNDEGIVALQIQGVWTLLMAADEERLAELIIIANDVASETGTTIKLIEFSQRSDLMTFNPRKD